MEQVGRFVRDINEGRFGRDYVAIMATYGGFIQFPGEKKPVAVDSVYFQGPEIGGAILHLFRRAGAKYVDMGFVRVTQDGTMMDCVVDLNSKGMWPELASIYFRENEFSVNNNAPEITRENPLRQDKESREEK